MTTTRKGANPYDKSSKSSSPTGGGDNNKMAWIIGGAVVAVIAVIAIVVFATGGDDGGEAEQDTGAAAAQNAVQENATVTISGEDLPPLGDSDNRNPSTDPAVGLDAPTLSGESFDGSEVVIDGEGGPKMVVFLAHWCPNCQEEVPVVQEWIDSGDVPEGLEILSVSTSVDSTRPNYPPSNWISSEGWTPKVLLDDEAQSAASSWGLPGYPYFVLVDADGKVWYRASGQASIEELNTLATELVSGESATPQVEGDGGGQTPALLPEAQPEG